MTAKPYKVAIVGVGEIARNQHIPFDRDEC